MDKFHQLRVKAFLESSDFPTIFRALIEAKKMVSLSFSQNSISAKLGFKAKSHISDILSGRRRFPEEKLMYLKSIFSLTEPEMFLLQLMFKVDRCAEEEKDNLFVKIQKTKSILKSDLYLYASPLSSSALAADIFFYLFKINNQVTLKDCQDIFSRYDETKILQTLRDLQDFGCIEKYNNYYKIADEFELTFKRKEAVKESFKVASKSIEEWFRDECDNLFGMTLVSGDYKRYLQHLEEFRQLCFEFFAELEELNDPDMLLRVNLAMYPIGKK